MWPIIKKAVNSDLSTPLNVLIDSVIDAIDTNVGSNANAASATGSLHAKIKELRNHFTNVITNATFLSRKTVSKDAGDPSGWDTTEKSFTGPSISGRGILRGIKITNANTSFNSFVRVVLTVDGVTVQEFGNSYGSGVSGFPTLGINGLGHGSPDIERLDFHFRSSVTCTIYYKVASGNAFPSPICILDYDQM